MFPYWLLFSVFAVGALQFGRQETSASRAAPLFAAGAVLVIVLIGLRFETGADWYVYDAMFKFYRYADLDQILRMGDPGYGLLNQLAQTLGIGLWFVNLVCAAIFGVGLAVFARQQPNPWLAVCVAVPYLIIVVAMGYTRQAVALGLIMIGLVALERNSIARFILCIVLAATFHKTAVIVLPLAALAAVRHRLVIAGMMAVVAYFLYSWFLAASLDRMISNYVDQEYSSQGAAIRVVMNVIPAALFLIFQKRFRATEAQRLLWRNFSLAAFGTLILLLALPSSTLVDRVALYIIPLQLFVFSRIPDAFPNPDGSRNAQLVLVVLLYSAIVQFTWLNYADHSKYWLPYQFYPSAE